MNAGLSKGVWLNIVSISFMSMSPLINKFSLGHISSTKAAFFNLVFTLLFCWLYSLVRGQKIVWINSVAMWFVGLTNAAGLAAMYLALELLSPVTVGLIGRFYLIFTLLLAVFILKEKLTRREWIVIGLAIIGVFLFKGGSVELSGMLGIAAALGYAFFFAFTNTLVKVVVKDADSNSVLFCNTAISIVLMFGWLLVRGEANLEFDWIGVGQVFLSALFSGFIGLILYYESLKYIAFSKATMIRSVGPILIILFSWPFFPVELSTMNIFGGLLLLGSVMWLTVGGQKEKSHSAK